MSVTFRMALPPPSFVCVLYARMLMPIVSLSLLVKDMERLKPL